MYHLKIVTPEEVIYDDTVISLIAPGTLGYFGILTDHAPLVSTLKEGILVITPKDHKKLYYKIATGFLEVRYNEAFILTTGLEETEPVDMESGL